MACDVGSSYKCSNTDIDAQPHNSAAMSNFDAQPQPKKRKIAQVSATVEVHVDPEIHSLYDTHTMNRVVAEATALIVEAMSKAEERLQRHTHEVATSGSSDHIGITPAMVHISSSMNTQAWTRRQRAHISYRQLCPSFRNFVARKLVPWVDCPQGTF